MIGILDSNLGGLILTKEIINKFPNYQVLYFADTAGGPFGNKGEETVKKCAEQGINFLIEKGAKLIIVSDPSMAIALKDVETKVPVISLIDWLIDSAVETSQNKRVGMIAPQMVVDSNFISNLKILTKATPLLLPLIREGWIKRATTKKVLKSYLYGIHCKQVDTLILADPAYSLLEDIIQIKIGKQVKIISPINIIDSYLEKFLKDNTEIEKNLLQGSSHQFFASDINNQTKHLARQWFGSTIQFSS